MNEVEEMFKKTSHSAKVFVMWLDPEGRTGTEECFPWFALVHTKEREGAPRKPDVYRRPRPPYVRREAWSLPGGKVEPIDYENILEDTGEMRNKRAFRKAAKREVEREAGIILSDKAFSEKLSAHTRPVPSDHADSDYLETHYYWAAAKTKEQHVPIAETDEVIEMEWFRLDQIPLPKPKKGYIATFPSHMEILRVFLLQKLDTKFEDADLWLKAYNARFGSFPLVNISIAS
jgi:8-oxo-dGTP pyrophosphatase MutT (NUDIX family)